MTVHTALQTGTSLLAQAGAPDPHTDATLLLSHVLQCAHMALLLRRDEALSPADEAAYQALLARRVTREPLQYILGEQWFYGRRFAVDPRALVPRQETETLCELALQAIHALRAVRAAGRAPAPGTPADPPARLRALDLCTGSGAIAVTLALEAPAVAVTAADLSADALALARENALTLGASVRFAQGDLFAPLAGERFELLVSNPPYVPRADCDVLQPEVAREPRMALLGGEDGLDFYRRIADEAPAYLAPGARVLCELGDGQAPSVQALFSRSFHDVSVHNDLYGHPRVVSAAFR